MSELLPHPAFTGAEDGKDFEAAKAVVERMRENGFAWDAQRWCDEIQEAIRARRQQ